MSSRKQFTSIHPETTPLYPSSVYTFPDLTSVQDFYSGNGQTYLYRRNGHPNEAPVASEIARLEHADDAILAASGMAAISQSLFAHLQPGDHILATKHFYGGTFALFEDILRPWGVDITYIDLNNAGARDDALQTNTRLVYAESIANPLLQVADMPAIGSFARIHNLHLFVDNTFATPRLMRPLDYGATLTIHSLTKYLNGHSDVIGGVAAGDAATVAKIRKFAVTFGGTLDPFDAWMTERGLETFALRFPRQCQNAQTVSAFLASHPRVSQVFYPGLPAQPDHNLAKQVLAGGFGAIVSFELESLAAANAVVKHAKCIDFAPSLGGVRSTFSHPGLTSHRAYSAQAREELGIRDGLLRLSLGIEPCEDIIADLEQSLRHV